MLARSEVPGQPGGAKLGERPHRGQGPEVLQLAPDYDDGLCHAHSFGPNPATVYVDDVAISDRPID